MVPVKRENLLGSRVKDLSLDDLLDTAESCRKIVSALALEGGFSSRYVARAARILAEMLSDKKCTILMGFTANIVATGMRGFIASLISRRLVDVVITTGGTIDHDIARSSGGVYYRGEFELDDLELKRHEIHRLGNILIPFENYGPIIESRTHEILDELSSIKDEWSPSELLAEVGKRLADTTSILYQAYRTGIPVFSPGLLDSAFGTAIFTYNEAGRSGTERRIKLDFIKDLKILSDIVFESERLGAVVLGGGISKHHIIWWSQFKGGLDYAVYISTAVEWDGSLSGARTREAVSWGKLKPGAHHVTVPADATVVFPLIVLSALGMLGADRRR